MGTMQGLIAGIYQGLASMFGTVGGGIIFKQFGPVFMYRMSAAIIFGWMIFFQIALRVIRLCDDSKGIKLILGEKIIVENDESLLKKSMAEAPKLSLLINEEIPIQT